MSLQGPVFIAIHERISRHAVQRPEAPAVSHDGVSINHAELARRSDKIAARLQRAGVLPGSLVAIGLERSIDMVVGLLAILKSGAAYLPIDTAHPRERLEFVFDDARPAALLTSSTSRAAIPAGDIPTLLLDVADGSENAGEAPAPHPVVRAPDDLAYVIYTSGSTGKPKGCQVTHGNVARLFTATEAWFGFGPDDVWTFFHSHAFDFSVWEIWGALVHGGRVVVVPHRISRSPQDFHRLLVQEGVTVLNQTPTAFRSLIAADASAEPAMSTGLALRHVIFGGEALELQMLRPWFERHGDVQPRLINMYGITETTVHVTYRPITMADVVQGRGSVIGGPIPDLSLHLLDDAGRAVPVGDIGELYVGGAGVCRGYLNRPELTAQRFVDRTDPDSGASVRLYRSGDLARRLPDGELEYLGRIDDQVKIRGFRIETGEIESLLAQQAGVRGCAVVPRKDGPGGETRLVAYVVPSDDGVPVAEWRRGLAAQLPEYMLPAAFVRITALPLTGNGKLDRKALPAPPNERPELAAPYLAPTTPLEQRVCAVFADVLAIDRAGRGDNFFELGGDSLSMLQALARLQRAGPRPLDATAFFRDPTPAAIAAALEGSTDGSLDPRRMARTAAQRGTGSESEPIAIIAMAGRFPGAASVEAFWDNLCAGRESITYFDDGSLDPSIPPALRNDPSYVRARGVIDDGELFDAAFFGIYPKEAALMDPQQRLLLELSWECIERAGYVPDASTGPVGVYAGMNNATYFQRHVQQRPDLIEAVGEFQVMLANEKDFVATRVAHRLNLTGPALSIHTACSTSLVAVAQAFQALRHHQCDMALAGGVSMTCPPRSGYLHQDGAMLSPDGHTRSFDAAAQGTVFSDGAGVVLLKRLSEALADGDPIHAVLRGAALNNDGGAKASFTAPSVQGQAAVIAAALDDAQVDARSISYVETHGTATPLGDPVEIEGLARAYARHTPDTGFCRIGSVKSNVGHLVIAAGAAGLIKTALSLESERIPPTLHFTAPNPKIDFDATPFHVNAALTPWPRGDVPRRAGVSSFGVGGTNAHVIVEEAPRRAPSDAAHGPQLLQLSARTPAALAQSLARLADHLSADEHLNLADVAYTLRVGRKAFAHRACLVAATPAEAVTTLRTADARWKATAQTGARTPEVVFLFPGQGAQYAGMGRGLYEADPVFRAAFDECLEALRGHLPFDLRERMFEGGTEALLATSVTQPATFVLEYAVARAWMARGQRPAALIGHSVGEFVAAVLAGVMPLAEALRLVAYRGSLMQALPAGAMLSVRLSAEALRARLPEGLSLAAENGPTACVVAGEADRIEALRVALEAEGIVARVLQTSHAFHSAMMDPAVAPFEARVREVRLQAPALPIFSTLTGEPLTAEQATDPHYWARHLRETVRFSPALRRVLADVAQPLLLEIGPRNTLSTLARQHTAAGRPAPAAVPSLADRPEDEAVAMLRAAGRLWAHGATIDLALLDSGRRHRVRLPTYPFERKRYWVEAAVPAPQPLLTPATEATGQEKPAPIPLSPTPRAAMPTTATPPATDRKPALRLRLRTLFEDISGLDMSGAEISDSTSFVELGLDSLTLTQAALQVKKQFGCAITFRQLMETLRSFDALAEHLDATLPPEPAAAPAVVVATAPVVPAVLPAAPVAMTAVPVLTMAAAPVGSALQQLLQQQMQLMGQQLALLGAAPAAVPATTGIAVPAAVPVVTAAVPAAPVSATAVTDTAAAPEAAQPIRYDVKKAFGAIARIHTQGSVVTERQKARLATFIRRYVERTTKSKAYTAEHRPHLADPRVVNGFRPMTKEITYQIVIDRSKGSKVWDLDGNEYVDVLNGFGMNLFGWQPDFVADAVRQQLDKGYEIGPQHPLAGEVAQLVCELTGFERAGLCNTGSEAVMAAIRIARTVTGRNTLVVFTGSYHGTFDEVLVRAGRGGKGLPAAPGILPGAFGDVRVLDYGTPESLEYIRSHADELAAVLVEPVQSRRPDFQPREFLREVRAITERSGTCLIFDEVITGFRAHLGGTQALFGIRADLASYGKVIGGGFPVGVVAGKREYMDSLDGGAWQYGDDSIPTVGVTYFAGTFVRHPLALAAAKASLVHLREQGHELQTRLNVHTAAMADELTAFCREVGAPLEVRHFASLWRVSWLEDHPLQDLLFAMMRSRGVHILDNFPCFMTTAHTSEDIARIKSAFKESIAELQEAQFLPRREETGLAVDPTRPPVPNARLGRDKEGRPTWFVPDPQTPGKYVKVNA